MGIFTKQIVPKWIQSKPSSYQVGISRIVSLPTIESHANSNKLTLVDKLTTPADQKVSKSIIKYRKSSTASVFSDVIDTYNIKTVGEDYLTKAALEWQNLFRISESKAMTLKHVMYAMVSSDLFTRFSPDRDNAYNMRMWIRSLLCIAANESRFHPSVENKELRSDGTRKSDAYGLIQLLSSTWNGWVKQSSKHPKVVEWLSSPSVKRFANIYSLNLGAFKSPIGLHGKNNHPFFQIVPVVLHLYNLALIIQTKFEFDKTEGWRPKRSDVRTTPRWKKISNKFSSSLKDYYLGRHLLLLLLTADGTRILTTAPGNFIEYIGSYKSWLVRFESTRTSASELVDKFINKSLISAQSDWEPILSNRINGISTGKSNNLPFGDPVHDSPSLKADVNDYFMDFNDPMHPYGRTGIYDDNYNYSSLFVPYERD